MSIDRESTVSSLVERLSAAELTVRIHAGLMLAEMGVEARPALPVLLNLQRSDDVHVRRLSVMVLGSLAQTISEAVPALQRALNDADEGVRRLAEETLEGLDLLHGRLRAA